MQTVVEEIIHTAVHEVVIETAMDVLIKKWEQLSFTFRKHYKGLKDRGFTLEDTDSIIQCVEDDSMQLQMLSISP